MMMMKGFSRSQQLYPQQDKQNMYDRALVSDRDGAKSGKHRVAVGVLDFHSDKQPPLALTSNTPPPKNKTTKKTLIISQGIQMFYLPINHYWTRCNVVICRGNTGTHCSGDECALRWEGSSGRRWVPRKETLPSPIIQKNADKITPSLPIKNTFSSQITHNYVPGRV